MKKKTEKKEVTDLFFSLRSKQEVDQHRTTSGDGGVLKRKRRLHRDGDAAPGSRGAAWSPSTQHVDSLQAHVQISVANVYICDRAERIKRAGALGAVSPTRVGGGVRGWAFRRRPDDASFRRVGTRRDLARLCCSPKQSSRREELQLRSPRRICRNTRHAKEHETGRAASRLHLFPRCLH